MKRATRHSDLFRQILSGPDPYDAIRDITHSMPIMVFWICPDGTVLNAHDAHHDNPPHNDRSVLASRCHKGHLRGRAAFIGDILYIVIYGDDPGKRWSKRQRKMLEATLPLLKHSLLAHGIDDKVLANVVVIDEWGR